MIARLLNRITTWLVGFGMDTYIHVIATMFVAWFVSAILTLLQLSGVLSLERPLSGLIGLFIAIIAGAVKEWMDERNGHSFSVHALSCNFVGASFFYFIYILM